MRIAKFQISSQNPYNKGIQPFKLLDKDLGAVVALVGKNGAGKSRILNIVRNYVSQLNVDEFRQSYITYLPVDFNRALASLAGVNAKISNELKNSLNKYFRVINHAKLDDANIGGLKFASLLSSENPTNIQTVIHGMDAWNLNEFNSLDIETVIAYLKNLTFIEADNFVTKAIEGTNTDSPLAIRATKDFSRFNEIVKIFLGKEFSYFKTKPAQGQFDTNLKFHRLDWSWKDLSPGEKILFRYAVLLYLYEYESKMNIRDCIIIIDEPELHLHPEYQIRLIDSLIELIGERGQLWIATHSIHILSHLDYESVLKVSNGVLTKPSRKNHGSILRELMDNEATIQELQTFINSVPAWAYANFIKECFEQPRVIQHTGLDDGQYKLLREKIDPKIQKTILDFGAGTGRIGHTLKEDGLLKNLKYHAFDIDPNNIEKLKASGLTENGYSDVNNIPTKAYDFVLMCNVLHEISPDEWLETFTRVKELLKEDGFLLVLEDLELVRGEKAHEYGYLTLGNDELNILFNNKTRLLLGKSEEERLMLYAISKKEISLSDNSILNAVKKLNENVLNKITKIRALPYDEILARKYAHYSQLFINSKLFTDHKGSKIPNASVQGVAIASKQHKQDVQEEKLNADDR